MTETLCHETKLVTVDRDSLSLSDSDTHDLSCELAGRRPIGPVALSHRRRRRPRARRAVTARLMQKFSQWHDLPGRNHCLKLSVTHACHYGLAGGPADAGDQPAIPGYNDDFTEVSKIVSRNQPHLK